MLLVDTIVRVTSVILLSRGETHSSILHVIIDNIGR